MSHNHQNITDYHAGDALDVIVTVTVDDEGIDPATLIDEATDIVWLMQTNEDDPDEEAILEKTLADGIETPGEGNDINPDQFLVHLGTGDTDGLGGTTVHHRARITDADGRRATVLTGTINIDH